MALETILDTLLDTHQRRIIQRILVLHIYLPKYLIYTRTLALKKDPKNVVRLAFPYSPSSNLPRPVLFLEQESTLRRSSDSIDPRSKPIPSLRDLHLNVRCGPREIASAKLLSRFIHFQHILAVDCIRVLCPGQSAIARRLDVRTRDPGVLLGAVDARVDTSFESLRPRLIGGWCSATC